MSSSFSQSALVRFSRGMLQKFFQISFENLNMVPFRWSFCRTLSGALSTTLKCYISICLSVLRMWFSLLRIFLGIIENSWLGVSWVVRFSELKEIKFLILKCISMSFV